MSSKITFNSGVMKPMNSSASASASASVTSTVPFILIFFTSMILHELALESISTIYSVEPYNFQHMATSITLFQFGFCVLLPLVFSKLSRYCCRGSNNSNNKNSNGKRNLDEKSESLENDVMKNFPKSWTELQIYIKLSAVVYGATALATMSLGYEGVTYVTKVVFKSAKLIPTMIVGVIMDYRGGGNTNGKGKKKARYGVWEYASAFLLCIGAAGFCMSPGDLSWDENNNNDGVDGRDADNMDANQDSSSGSSLGDHWMGVGLLTASVFCDALVPNIQEQLMHGSSGSATSNNDVSKSSSCNEIDEEIEMKSLLEGDRNNGKQQISPQRKQNKGLSSACLMVNTNSIGFTLLLLSTILSSTLFPIIAFASAHPHFLMHLITIGMGLGSAVLAYTELIRRSGPAVAVAVATLRKVVTVLLSYIIFPKAISSIHFAAGGLVLGGLVVGFVGKGKK